ncbi:MAG TPA: hypothetical protein DCR91_03125 [Eubacterium sp.]|nr:hypothetical protein [Eubacterium sp.]HAZ86138.1 hypothetical protein [Eubacterium sp.]
MANEEYSQVLTKDNEGFFRFIESKMKGNGITTEQLTSGLCDMEEWNNLLSGEYMDKLMMSRLLDRLGCRGLRCDILLFASEYDDWQTRMDIVSAINDGETELAEKILEEYACRKIVQKNIDKMGCNERLEYQFVLMMQAYIMLGGRFDRTELIAKLQEAAVLTIPQGVDVAFDNGMKIILSVQELDILLEYYYQLVCREIEEKNIKTVDCYIGRIRKVIDYILSADWFNALSKAGILPKAVYYVMLSNQKKIRLNMDNEDEFIFIAEELKSYGRWLSDYDNAIEVLRDCGRIYYLAELCDMMDAIVSRMKKLLSEEVCKSMKLDDIKNTADRCREMLLYIEKLTGISRYTKNGMYMYFEPNVYRMEKAVADRRRLLGITQNQLAEGICTAKTIRRLEQGHCRPHGYNLYEILNRLELYSDFVMDEIVSYNAGDMELLEKVYDAIGMNETERAQELLQTLKANLDMGYTRNRQTIERLETNFAYGRREIELKVYLEKMKNIIGYSVKYEHVLKNPAVYLTSCETTILHNMQNKQNEQDRLMYLYSIPSQYVRGELFIRKIEFCKTKFASDAGNRGEYEKSNSIFMDVIQKNTKLKRIYNIDRCIYGIWWNNNMQHKYSTEQSKELLNICIDISDFSKGYVYKQFFLKQYKINFE